MELLDAVIDRKADILERAGGDIDNITHNIFEPEGRPHRPHQPLFRHPDRHRPQGRPDLEGAGEPRLGRPRGDLRGERGRRHQMAEGDARAAKIMQRDVQSLTDHASYLSNKVTFVLDAMLGVVNVEQNNIIKLFSVAAVVLMPPTVIASIYGMNFKQMPELEWTTVTQSRS